MATPKRPGTGQTLPDQPSRPVPLPAEDDQVREVGKRAYRDVRGPRKDTDQEGRDEQRRRAPSDAPTHRTDKTGGTDDR